MDVAGVVPADGAGQFHLVNNLRGGASRVFPAFDAGGGDSGPDRASSLGAPPSEEFSVALWAGNTPVELRRHVVALAFLKPLSRIGGEVFVGVDRGGGASRHAGLPDTKRADADPHPRFCFFHGAVHLADKVIDVGAALRWRFAIGKLPLRVVVFIEVWVGVEVVVDVDAIDIVAAGDIGDDSERSLAGEAFCRVHPLVGLEFFHDGRVGAGDVIFSGGDSLAG